MEGAYEGAKEVGLTRSASIIGCVQRLATMAAALRPDVRRATTMIAWTSRGRVRIRMRPQPKPRIRRRVEWTSTLVAASVGSAGVGGWVAVRI